MDNQQFEVEPTGAGLHAFLDHAIRRGYLKASTGQSMKSAVKEVLISISDEESWGQVELDSLDIDDVESRFETLRAMKFAGGTLRTYSHRFRKSIVMFEEFRESPSTWRPSVLQRDRRSKTLTQNEHDPAQSNEADDRSPALTTPGVGSGHHSLISYPFPLRESVLATLHLPPDLSQREARRLADFIEALAIDKPTTDSAAT